MDRSDSRVEQYNFIVCILLIVLSVACETLNLTYGTAL